MGKVRKRVTGDTSKAALARALRMSRPMLYKHAARGMPTDSEKSARVWLRQNTTGKHGPDATPEGVTQVTGDTSGDNHASELKGLSLAELTKHLMVARIKLTDRDTALRALQARQSQMDADLRAGKLLHAEEEARKSSELAIALRSRLMDLPNQCALQLAALTDPALVAEFLRKRIKVALIEFCAAYGVISQEQVHNAP
jgi:MarR-like DNA-binding transcriptional regulator SgrR of sgrS sRNA